MMTLLAALEPIRVRSVSGGSALVSSESLCFAALPWHKEGDICSREQ